MGKIDKEADRLEKEIKLEKYKTALKKGQFVNDIRGGLGAEIKKNPNQIKIIKKTLGQKVKAFFLSIFTKF